MRNLHILLISGLFFLLPPSFLQAATEIIGVGIVLGEKNGAIFIREILPKGPADQNGNLEKGDVILAITEGGAKWKEATSLKGVSKQLQGKENTKVKIKIRRGEKETLEVELTRKRLTLPSGIQPLRSAEEIPDLGAKAEPLEGVKWLKGGPVDLAKLRGKKAVVVEFWTTWCGPCVQSIPHLTRMQKDHPEVVFIGLTDEPETKAVPFIEKMGDKMDYVVGTDPERKTHARYMDKYGVRGIPHAFVISKEGTVVWHNHPMSGLEEVLNKLRDGSFDIDQYRIFDLLRRYQDLAIEGEDKELGDLQSKIEAMATQLGDRLPPQTLNFEELRRQGAWMKAMNEYSRVMQKDPENKALADLEEQLKQNAPPGFSVDDFKQSMKANRVFNRYLEEAFQDPPDQQKLEKAATDLRSANVKDPQVINHWAWFILTQEELKNRDLKLALDLAKRALDLSKAENAAILDTYARALMDNGKNKEAIKYQRKAIEKAESPEQKTEMEETLKKYEVKK